MGDEATAGDRGEVPNPAAVPQPAVRLPSDPEPTVGTGSAVAVGCTAATLLVILVGVVVLLLVRLL